MLHLLVYFMVTSLALADVVNPLFCNPPEIVRTGFIAKFYNYTHGSKDGYSTDFFSSTYKTTLLKKINGVTNPNFQIAAPNNAVTQGSIYGYSTTISNYTIELTGWYKPTKESAFTFTLSADEGAALRIGGKQECCNDAAYVVTDEVSINTLGTTSGSDPNTGTFRMLPKNYYPFALVLFNSDGDAKFDLTITDSSGKKITNFWNNVYDMNYPDGGACYHTTTTTYWTNDYTSSDFQDGTETDTVIMQLPPTYAPTTTSTWTGTFTTTETITGSGGTFTPAVLVPTPLGATSTSTWTGSVTSTTTISGADGVQTPVVVVPHAEGATSTSTWTGSDLHLHHHHCCGCRRCRLSLLVVPPCRGCNLYLPNLDWF
ncbi:hypothetical protein JCM33374_g6580 [Metschnikowia sp. JCM 33374]|nr:hypothetical protein JCM33374_g6580 [Metschnikowia sp. JCM 33374]